MTEQKKRKIRIAAIADLHVKTSDSGKWKGYFARVSEEAEVVLMCGDVTNGGSPEEAAVLGEELQGCRIPVVGVLGNHDYAMDCPELVLKTLREAGVQMLAGDYTIVEGVGFAGVKGFGGGFDRYRLSGFGERAIKDFVAEALKETRLLEDALTRLEMADASLAKVVLLHYAPLQATVLGEPEPLYPFLGSSRLSEPLVRHEVRVAFHGHAHSGSLQGRIAGVEVYNVAHEVLVRSGYDLPFFLYEM